MSYKNDSILVVLNKYGKAGGIAKAELYETYDQIRDLTVSGPALGGSGMGKVSSFLVSLARVLGSTAFSPTLGNAAINIPGTSYYAPISGGAGVIPGGQAAFGLAPFSQYTGLPTGGAAPLSWSPAALLPNASTLGPLTLFAASGIGALNSQGDLASSFLGVGDEAFPSLGLIGGADNDPLDGGAIVGGATPVDPSGAVGAISNAGGAATGVAAGMGFGRNLALPAASLMSAVGGLMTTLGPFFGPTGLAGVAAGSLLNGAAGAILNSFQHVSSRMLANGDSVLTEKVRNLETTIKMLDAQQDILKKLLKESLDGDKKALDNI